MDAHVQAAWGRLIERLLSAASQTPGARDDLLVVLQDAVARLSRPEPAAAEPTIAAPPPVAPPAPPAPLPPPAPVVLGRPRIVGYEPIEPPPPAPAPAERPAWPEVPDARLPETVKRLRLKAEATRWRLKRERLNATGADFDVSIAPQDRDLIDRAKSLACRLWMSDPYGPTADATKWEALAACYDVTAEACEFIHALITLGAADNGIFEQAVQMLARAQSALRVAVKAIRDDEDPEQRDLHYWLRRTTQDRQIFIAKHMRLDDPADPGSVHELLEAISMLRGDTEQRLRAARDQQKALRRIEYHAGKVLAAAEAGSVDDVMHDWRTIDETIGKALEAGVRPSAVELRDALLPIVDLLPESWEPSDAMRRVLREVDRFLANRPEEAEPPMPGLTTELLDARNLVEGTELVVIGGEARHDARRKLKDAFGLREVHWPASREHGRVSDFEPTVAQPRVSVVCLAIRWSSHSYEEVSDFCRTHGKLLVRLPGGYNPNQVAHQILQQVGERLRRGEYRCQRGA